MGCGSGAPHLPFSTWQKGSETVTSMQKKCVALLAASTNNLQVWRRYPTFPTNPTEAALTNPIQRMKLILPAAFPPWAHPAPGGSFAGRWCDHHGHPDDDHLVRQPRWERGSGTSRWTQKCGLGRQSFSFVRFGLKWPDGFLWIRRVFSSITN